MQLTEHFSLEELTRSTIAERKGLDNSPSVEQAENLKMVAQTLERVRELLGKPLVIDSAYRSPKVNAAVGGSQKSAHMDGRAADFVSPEFGTPREICLAIKESGIEFDQLIFEGSWVHIGIADSMRHQVLTAHFGGSQTTYTAGVS